MIIPAKGNLLMADVGALVNTVNTVGVMGKGIALQFKRGYPENFEAYKRACDEKILRVGEVFIYSTGLAFNPQYIINFPSKEHWRSPSTLEIIMRGLDSLVKEVRSLGIKSIAIPPLGSGYGGLDWHQVKPLIREAFDQLTDVVVHLYEPQGSPDPKSMLVRTRMPELNRERAALILLMIKYCELDYKLSLLEIHKLAYFLQESGMRLKLNWEAGHYGPYARKLNNVLELIEGHYITGLGDNQKPDNEVELIRDKIPEVIQYLEDNPKPNQWLQVVGKLINGFETPFGMELLSSVHWAATKVGEGPRNADDAVKYIQNWNARKRELFKPDHIRIAWSRLESMGWLQTTMG